MKAELAKTGAQKAAPAAVTAAPPILGATATPPIIFTAAPNAPVAVLTTGPPVVIATADPRVAATPGLPGAAETAGVPTMVPGAAVPGLTTAAPAPSDAVATTIAPVVPGEVADSNPFGKPARVGRNGGEQETEEEEGPFGFLLFLIF